MPKTKKRNKSIIIEVYGGVASVIQTYKGITITIKDHDNKRAYINVDGQNAGSIPLR